MIPISEQEEFEFRLRAEQESSQLQQEPNKPSGFSKFMTNISRPGATNRAMIREGLKTGSWEKAGLAGAKAWENPESSETFQNEFTRKAINAIPSNSMSVNMQTGMGAGAVGLGADFITDPVQTGATAATEGLWKLIAPLKLRGLNVKDRVSKLPVQNILSSEKSMRSKEADLASKAIENTEHLLKPTGDFSKDIKSGRTPNMVEQSRKYIQPSKNYTEVVDQLELAKGFPMQERQAIYESQSASPLFHDELNSLRAKINSSPQASSRTTSNATKQIDDIFTADVESLNNATPEELADPNFYQKRKEFYQAEADKAGAYGGDENMSHKAEAYRALARDYQNKLYSLDEAVKPLNLENAGLEEASSRASELAQVERGQAPPSMPREVVESVRPTKVNNIVSLIRNLSKDRLFNPVRRFTTNIHKYQTKSEKAGSVADLIEELASKQDLADITYNTPKQIGRDSELLGLPEPPPEPQKQIGKDRRFSLSRLLQNQLGGKTIQAEGRGVPIQLPEYLESDFSRLGKKFNAPEYSGKKESEGLSRSEGQAREWFNKLTPKQKYTLREIVNKRKRNFPDA